MRFSGWEERGFRVGLMEKLRNSRWDGLDGSFSPWISPGGVLRDVDGAGNRQIPKECCPFLGTHSGFSIGCIPKKGTDWETQSLNPILPSQPRGLSGNENPTIGFSLEIPAPNIHTEKALEKPWNGWIWCFLAG